MLEIWVFSFKKIWFTHLFYSGKSFILKATFKTNKVLKVYKVNNKVNSWVKIFIIGVIFSSKSLKWFIIKKALVKLGHLIGWISTGLLKRHMWVEFSTAHSWPVGHLTLSQGSTHSHNSQLFKLLTRPYLHGVVHSLKVGHSWLPFEFIKVFFQIRLR